MQALLTLNMELNKKSPPGNGDSKGGSVLHRGVNNSAFCIQYFSWLQSLLRLGCDLFLAHKREQRCIRHAKVAAPSYSSQVRNDVNEKAKCNPTAAAQ